MLQENKKTPSARILEFLREQFVDGIDTFSSHKWLSIQSLEVLDINGDTAVISYDEATDTVTLV